MRFKTILFIATVLFSSTITFGQACSGTPAIGTTTSNSNPVCAGSAFILSITSATGITGLTYQWESSPDNATYANITGAINASYSTSQTTATYYRCIVTCTASGLSSTTTTLYVTIQGPAYTTLAYSQSFQASWQSLCASRDIPDSFWRSSPVSGENSWRKVNEGATASWASSTAGAYSPTGSLGTSSARFHSSGAPNGSIGNLDLYIDLSSATSELKLSFDYINTSGTDSLFVLLSEDGGITFNAPIAKLATTGTWAPFVYNLSTTSATSVIRFRAKSDLGSSDIGIDNLKLMNYNFLDVSTAVGLSGVNTFRLNITDINNDDYPDLLLADFNPTSTPTHAIRGALRVYLNVQDTSASSTPQNRMFVNVTASSGINVSSNPNDPLPRVSNLMALADVNNDGYTDIVTGNYYHRLQDTTGLYSSLPGSHSEVMLNDGTGHFTIVPNNGLHELGLYNPSGFSFLDYDKDGNIDLFISTWFHAYTGSNSPIDNKGVLMKGNGDGTFTNTSTVSGVDQIMEPMYGCSVTDWDNDGWPDITTAPYCRTRGQLLKNLQNGTFADIAQLVGYNIKYMQGDRDTYEPVTGRDLCAWGNIPEDFDNDGDMDMMLALNHGGYDTLEGRSTIMINGGPNSSFQYHWELNRIRWKSPRPEHIADKDASWLDIDNDGLMDLIVTQSGSISFSGQPNISGRLFVFKQDSLHYFNDVTAGMGLIASQYQTNENLEVADYDLDGYEDALISKGNGGRDLFLLQNIGDSNGNNWVSVKLLAPPGVNKNCIGARIKVFAGSLVKTRDVYAGRGNFSGQQPFILVFGLGNHSVIDSIQVSWPNLSNTYTTVLNPPIDQMVTIGNNGLILETESIATKDNSYLVYPNPASEFILIQPTDGGFLNDIATIEMYDVVGRKIDNLNSFKNGSASMFYDISSLSEGTYIIRITEGSGKMVTRKIIKMK